MRLLSVTTWAVLAAALLLAACDGGPDRAAVAETYADVAYASYADAYAAAEDLDAAIDAFLAEPTEARMEAAKEAWLAAREPYGQTEAFRFAGGPIDDADGPEPLINAWPLDEAYIDYVEGDADAGVINSEEAEFATLDGDLLVSLNERGGEENVAVGFHAIEFLLWGQDLSADGPGERPVSDYTTAPNAERRKRYLDLTSDLLLGHLAQMVDAWDPNAQDNYRAAFLALDPDEALRHMLTGIGTLAKSELAVERMFVAVNNQDQEDEHSCFSDNTHRDIITNAQGIANVYRGRYERTDGSTVEGPSLADLVRDADPETAEQVETHLDDALAEVRAIPVPFDQAIIHDQQAVLTAVQSLQATGDAFVAAAADLDLAVNTELPE